MGSMRNVIFAYAVPLLVALRPEMDFTPPLQEESSTFWSSMLQRSYSSGSHTRRSAAWSTLLRQSLPQLHDDSEVKQAVIAGVADALKERMKVFPGLTTTQQLLEWNANIGGPRLGPVKSLPNITSGRRILSMHDMASGYNALADNDYLLLFRSWPYVDLFVYFSHVRIAIPPLQWTLVAHLHQRPALGTIMFEAESGAGLIDQIAKNRNVVLDQLVNLADHYGFDGWFVNIESTVDWPNGDPELFVGELRSRMKRLLGERAQVIAYPYWPDDPMFKAADGVFVNYNWPSDAERMQEVASAAGLRSADVYMGMDGFGGERGNNEPEPSLVQKCARNNLSIAVFAPGVTYEVHAKKKYSDEAVAFDKRYWASIGENFGRPVMEDVSSGSTWPVPWDKTTPKIGRESLHVGERVKVRDGNDEVWQRGTVTSSSPVRVKRDGWKEDGSERSLPWKQIRSLQTGSFAPGESRGPKNSAGAAGSAGEKSLVGNVKQILKDLDTDLPADPTIF